MRQNNRSAKRAQRKFRIAGREVEMNIVSLIDIFAILVFYLLVSALTVEILPTPNALQLPKSVVRQPPEHTPVIMVTKTDIFVDNRRVMPTEGVDTLESAFLPALKEELLKAPLQRSEKDASTPLNRGDINIMADKSIPYAVLKKVMASCTEARFARIALTVVEKKNGAAP